MSNYAGIVRIFRLSSRFSLYRGVKTCSIVGVKSFQDNRYLTKPISRSLPLILGQSQVRAMSALSPNDPASYSRPEIAVIRHIDLDLDVDFDRKVLNGTALLNIEAKQEVNEMILDVSNLTIDSVLLDNGTALKYNLSEHIPNYGSKLTVTLPSPVVPGQKNRCNEGLTKLKESDEPCTNCMCMKDYKEINRDNIPQTSCLTCKMTDDELLHDLSVTDENCHLRSYSSDFIARQLHSLVGKSSKSRASVEKVQCDDEDYLTKNADEKFIDIYKTISNVGSETVQSNKKPSKKSRERNFQVNFEIEKPKKDKKTDDDKDKDKIVPEEEYQYLNTSNEPGIIIKDSDDAASPPPKEGVTSDAAKITTPDVLNIDKMQEKQEDKGTSKDNSEKKDQAAVSESPGGLDPTALNQATDPLVSDRKISQEPLPNICDVCDETKSQTALSETPDNLVSEQKDSHGTESDKNDTSKSQTALSHTPANGTEADICITCDTSKTQTALSEIPDNLVSEQKDSHGTEADKNDMSKSQTALSHTPANGTDADICNTCDSSKTQTALSETPDNLVSEQKDSHGTEADKNDTSKSQTALSHTPANETDADICNTCDTSKSQTAMNQTPDNIATELKQSSEEKTDAKIPLAKVQSTETLVSKPEAKTDTAGTQTPDNQTAMSESKRDSASKRKLSGQTKTDTKDVNEVPTALNQKQDNLQSERKSTRDAKTDTDYIAKTPKALSQSPDSLTSKKKTPREIKTDDARKRDGRTDSRTEPLRRKSSVRILEPLLEEQKGTGKDILERKPSKLSQVSENACKDCQCMKDFNRKYLARSGSETSQTLVNFPCATCEDLSDDSNSGDRTPVRSYGGKSHRLNYMKTSQKNPLGTDDLEDLNKSISTFANELEKQKIGEDDPKKKKKYHVNVAYEITRTGPHKSDSLGENDRQSKAGSVGTPELISQMASEDNASAKAKTHKANSSRTPSAMGTIDETDGDDENRFNLKIVYATSPTASALQWLEPSQTSGKKHPYLFSQCQPIHARSIVPCQDTAAVKFTYSARVRAPPPFTALMSALPEGHADRRFAFRQPPIHARSIVPCQDTAAVKFTYSARVRAPPPFTALMSALPEGHADRRFAFRQPVPIPSYLLAIAVGVLESKTIGPRTKVWSEKEEIDKSAWEFAETEKYLTAAERLCGPYEWTRYDLLVLPPSFPYGGMENPCLTFVTPTLLAGDRSQADVIVHEIMHSWTGNLVTNKNFEHFWLNEGFTVFLERKVAASLIDNAAEAKKSRDFHSLLGLQELNEAVIVDLGANNPLTKLVVDLRGTHPDDAFSTVPYEKGSLFLRYLEDLVGIDVFDEFIRSYLRKFARTSIETDQFKEYLINYFTSPPASAALAAVDWSAWLHEPGLPPQLPDYDTSMTKSITDLLQKIPEESHQFTKEDVKGFTPHQIIHLLQELIDKPPLPVERLESLGVAYNIVDSKNTEIKYRWLRLCAKSKSIERVPGIFKFLNSQGRMKYVRPLYRDLYAWKEVRDQAIDNFLRNEPFMMHVSAYTLRKDLHLTDQAVKI